MKLRAYLGTLFCLIALSACSSAPKKEKVFVKGMEVCKSNLEDHKGLELPQVQLVSPTEGGGLGGTQITIAGDGFEQGAMVFVDGNRCYDVRVLDPQNITCLVPAHKGGAADILVVNPDRSCGFKVAGFSYIRNVQIQPRSKIVAIGNDIQFKVANGRRPYNFTLVSGSGALDAVTGTYKAPDVPGTAIVRVTDAMNTSSDSVITINPKLEIVPSTEPGLGGFFFKVIGGAPPITHDIQTTERPSEDGKKTRLSAITVRDAAGNEAAVNFELDRVGPLVIYPSVLKVVPADQVRMFASGGVPPYTWSVTGSGKIQTRTGIYNAPMEPGSDVIRVTDSAGSSQEAQVTVASDAVGLFRLALGYGHSCALIAEGSVRCWGDNREGQLGDGTMISKKKPAMVMGLGKSAVSVTAGLHHTCAVLAGGTARCWGNNRYGQIGDHSSESAAAPTTVFGLHSGVQSIATGHFHSCAVVRGAALCWGSNRRGQLGNGSLEASNIPTPVKGLGEGVVAITAGAGHSCALTREGGVKCWGYNYSGQLGDGTLQDSREPIPVKELASGVTMLVAGAHHTCAIHEGRLKCWGLNGMGQLGNGTRRNALVPTLTQDMDDIMRVSAGWYHTCAQLRIGEVRCWGHNQAGQIGTPGDEGLVATPRGIADLTDVTALGTGANHSCALVLDGVRCWGSNQYGQFGNRVLTSSRTPNPPAELK